MTIFRAMPGLATAIAARTTKQPIKNFTFPFISLSFEDRQSFAPTLPAVLLKKLCQVYFTS
ncbi:hypothetical protein YDYSY3_40490 [Paenibacillus chitinolyticus]|nr:hypothetical protein YDYSY3_40490 [Paenibacillus chitinolyticus]